MGFFVDIPQPLNIVVGVYLGRSETAVPEQLFDCIEFGAISGEMGGKTMAQYMRTFLVCSGH